jgi:trigger factor
MANGAQIEKISPVRARITVTIDAETVNKELEKVYRQIRREAAVPGFRPGKAPMDLLKRRYGEVAKQEVKRNLVGEHLAQVVEEHKIQPIGTPELEKDEFQEDGSLIVIAVMETRPEIALGEYQGIEIAREKPRVLPAAIETRLEAKRQQMATVAEIADRDIAEKGDLAKIDFAGTIDGKPFKEGEYKGVTLEVGKAFYYPGMGEALEGMKKGETKNLTVNLPADFPQEEIAGKTAEFAVTLHALSRREVPNLDDDLAKDTGEAETLDELRRKIHDEILKSEEERTISNAKKALVNKLVAMHPIDVPQSLVEGQMDYMVRRFKMELAMAGVQMPEDAEADQRLRARVADDAKKEVQSAFLFHEIAKAENLEVTDADLQAEYEKIAARQGRKVEEISAYYQKEKVVESLRERLLEQKVVDFLYAGAKVTWEEEKAEPPAASPPAETAEAVPAETGEAPAEPVEPPKQE